MQIPNKFISTYLRWDFNVLKTFSLIIQMCSVSICQVMGVKAFTSWYILPSECAEPYVSSWWILWNDPPYFEHITLFESFHTCMQSWISWFAYSNRFFHPPNKYLLHICSACGTNVGMRDRTVDKTEFFPSWSIHFSRRDSQHVNNISAGGDKCSEEKQSRISGIRMAAVVASWGHASEEGQLG